MRQGEGSKTDSVRQLVTHKYPASDLAMQFKVAPIIKESDTTKRSDELEALLKTVDRPGTAWSIAAQKALFLHFAATRKEAAALDHAAKSLGETTPYTARDLKDIALKLTVKHLAPAIAFSYAERALEIEAVLVFFQ